MTTWELAERAYGAIVADGYPASPGIVRHILAAIDAAVAATREEDARLCSRRACSWTEADDARSDDYREGIEVAASQLAAAIRAGRPT